MGHHRIDAKGPLPAAGVLVHRRSRGGPQWLLLRNARAGHWGFAKGHLEEGESELAGALREVKEETGLLPRLDGAFREELRYRVENAKRGSYDKVVVYFVGSVAEDARVRASDEHDRVEWLDLEGARRLLEHEQLRALLARADRYVRQRAGA